MRFLVFLIFYIWSPSIFSQISNFEEKFELPNDVRETSGLLFLNGKIITHNDSGDGPNLYEIDSLSGLVTRTISVTNASHIDWEDITQDENHIYIGDIGNNNGNRTDLKVYKVSKSDFLNSTSVNAEIISFSYEDQTNFTSSPNNTNFDSEALAYYDNKLYIFTKNWINFQTNVYTIPADRGSYSAKKVSSYNTESLVTGVSYNKNDDSFMLTSYDSNLNVFLFFIDRFRTSDEDIFASGAIKTDLTGILEQGSQVEGITFYDNSKYYLSREYLSTTVGGNKFEFQQKLYQFSNDGFSALSAKENSLRNLFNLYPNPFSDNITLNIESEKVQNIFVFSMDGREVFQTSKTNTLLLKDLAHGHYLLKILLSNGVVIKKKIIKN